MADVGEGLQLTVIGREYCHLCGEMIDALQHLKATLGFDIQVLDVDSDPEMVAKYDELVPVLVHNGIELCRFRLNPDAVRAYIAGLG